MMLLSPIRSPLSSPSAAAPRAGRRARLTRPRGLALRAQGQRGLGGGVPSPALVDEHSALRAAIRAARVDTAHVARREVLGAAVGLAAFAASSQPAAAKIIDQARAQKVFDESTLSVTSISLFEKGGGGDLVPAGVGSGIVWDRYGHIVTNYHVVQKAVTDTKGKIVLRVGVQGSDGVTVEYEPEVLGIDPAHDLAVLAIDVGEVALSAVKVGNSQDLQVGQSVFAIGNPSGLSHTLTAGVVSGLKRSIPSPNGVAIPNAIQTDAAINAGNSGGPLLDSGGRVVGLNTATFTAKGSGRSSGVNFAVDINTVRAIVPQLIIYRGVRKQLV